MPKIGPTGEFPFGGPAMANDRGSIYVGFKCLREHRVCVLKFKTTVTVLTGSIPEVLVMMATVRLRIEETWGKLTYNKAELPIQVKIHDGNFVQIVLPIPAEMLVCNPEVMLALAEVVDDRLAEAGLTPRLH